MTLTTNDQPWMAHHRDWPWDWDEECDGVVGWGFVTGTGDALGADQNMSAWLPLRGWQLRGGGQDGVGNPV